MTFKDFISKCTACGGNWTSMIFTGLREVAPSIYEAMPDRSYSFDEVCFIVNTLCEDRPHFAYNLSLDGNVIHWLGGDKFEYREATAEELAMTAEEFHQKYNVDVGNKNSSFDSRERGTVKPIDTE